MDYFEVSILGSTAVYQEVSDEGIYRYTDAVGNTVEPPVEPISYQLRNWSRPSWAAPIDVIQTPRIISKLDYMDRFLDSELAAIFTAAKTVVQIEIWLEKFKLAEFIDLTDTSVTGGLAALESVGLLAAGRPLEIINA